MQAKIRFIFMPAILTILCFSVYTSQASVPFRQGEWITQNANAPATGTYEIALRVAAETSGGTLAVQVDGETKDSGLAVPNTGSLTTYATLKTSRFTLNAGLHEVKVLCQTNSGSGYTANFNWLYLKLVSPSNLQAVTMSSSSIKLTWEDNSDYETSQVVERKTGSGDWTQVTSLGANVETYTDTGLSMDTAYSYRIVAYDDSISLGSSEEVSVAIATALIPGDGWTDLTAQPDPVGTEGQFGYDAKAIARWDVVPYQYVEGDFQIGVVAFHINGIDRVEFSVNNGPWTAVREMTLNPRTNVVEYWTVLRASSFSQDGTVEVRAIAYPNVGIPTVLAGTDSDGGNRDGRHSVYLLSNYNGTKDSPATVYVNQQTGSDSSGDGSEANPYYSLTSAVDYLFNHRLDGGIVKIQAAATYWLYQGDRYASRWSNSRYITIEPIDSLVGDPNVIVKAGTRPRVKFIKWKNVKIDVHQGRYTNEADEYTWWDHVTYYDSNGFDCVSHQHYVPVVTSSRTFVTDSVFTESVYGPANFKLVRNCQAIRIGGDAWQNSQFVVNCSVDTIGGRTDGWHADVIQLFGNPDNNIYYNLHATNVRAQGIFHDKTGPVEGQGYRNIAYVDLDFSDGQTQLSSWNTNVFFKNVNINSWIALRGPSSIYTEEFRGYNVVFDSCVFSETNINNFSTEDGVTVR